MVWRASLSIGLLGGLLLGCPSPGPNPADIGFDGFIPDAVVDAVADADPDSAMDAAFDASVDAEPDAYLDATLDGTLDTGVDTGLDMTVVDAGGAQATVRISELMAKNEGAWVDEAGETDDWLELHNFGDVAVSLEGFTLADQGDDPHALGALTLEAGEYLVLWADDELNDGPHHLPFKLSAGGDALTLRDAEGRVLDSTVFDGLTPNEVWARFDADWMRCRWPSPGRENGAQCGPPPPPDILDDVEFEDYLWPMPWPAVTTPLEISELALHPARFVEVRNTSGAEVDLAQFHVRLAAHEPGAPWPSSVDGIALPWPEQILAPGARVVMPVDQGSIDGLPGGLAEGVVTVWGAEHAVIDRVDFMAWPEGATLARFPEGGRHRFCAESTEGAANEDCQPLVSRAVGVRLRHLRTPGDFAALARGGVQVGTASVKFIIDMERGDAIHLLSAEAYDLHYRFVRREIDGSPPLDRCDPDESAEFTAGWRAFSEINYFSVDRRYLMGTLVHYGGSDLYTVEFSAADVITPAQISRAFFGAAAAVERPIRYSIRARSGGQVETLRALEGQAPMVGPLAPYQGVTYQALTATVGYGVLTFVPVADLEETPLGAQVIVVTDEVPNDIALTAGLITETFQTPLAHVNLLSRNRNTPNMALLDARNDPRIAPFFGQLVRLEVEGASFAITPVSPIEAEAFWESRRSDAEPLSPRLDQGVRGPQPLIDRGLEDLPSLGAKAAQLAELMKVVSNREPCVGPIRTPAAPMGIPVVHSVEHYAASGALARLEELRADADFRTDPGVRAAGLAEVQDLVRQHPVDPELVAQIEDYIESRYGRLQRVRFRSSSNTEDLPGFNGAGLYLSLSAQLNDPDRQVPDVLRAVWASLYSARAYEERDYHNIDQDGVAMGVLVHPAFISEEANGVAISRNILEPIRIQDYINVQVGEASVANPAPGVSTEQLIYDRRRTPRVQVLARSSLTDGEPVVSTDEANAISCTVREIQQHFEPLIDPAGENRWFAMDIEFKLMGASRALWVKQARPYSFGATPIPVDCREL